MLQCKMGIDFFVQCNIFHLPPANRARGELAKQGSARTPEEVNEMVKNIDEFQQIGKDNMDATLKSFGALSKGAQAIAVEVADYTRKVFEQGTAVTEKLIGAKSLDKAFEVQSDYVKNSYEGFVAQATKLSELYADVAKEAYKPFESQFGKVAAVTK